MIKKIKTKAFKDRLRGHKDGIITLYSPEGPQSGMLLSASKDGCIRAWNLIERKITTKLFVSRVDSQKLQELQDKEDESEQDLQDKEYMNGEENDEEDEDQEDGEGEEDDDDQGEDEENDESEQKQESLNMDIDKYLYDKNQDKDQQFSCAVFSSNCLYAGFHDGMIFSWSITTGEITQILSGHLDRIISLQFLNSRQLVSSSYDHTVRVWDTMLSGPVSALRTSGQSTIHCIVSKNTYVRLDSEKNKVLQSVSFQNTVITCFITYKQYLILGTIENTIEIYDLENIADLQAKYEEQEEENAQLPDIQPYKTIEGIQGWVLSMNILDQYLFIGGDDSNIKVLNLEKNFKCVEDLEGHRDGVISIEFAGNMLYSGSFDHSIRSWDLKEMYNRIRERQYMSNEDLWSKKHDAYYTKLHSKKKKKKGKKGKKGKKKK